MMVPVLYSMTFVFAITILESWIASSQSIKIIPEIHDVISSINDNHSPSGLDLYDDYDDDDDDDEADGVDGEVDARQLKHLSHLHASHATPQLIPVTPVMVMETPHPIVVSHVEFTDVKRVTSCPPGFDSRGDSCITNEVSQPEMLCPPGHQLIDGRCLLFARVRKDCPPPFQLSSTGTCTSIEVVPVQYSCPEGTLDETGRGCQVPQIGGQHQCPSGFSLQGNVCIQKFPASLQCPEGYEYSHKSCTRTKSFEASPMCPEGSTIDDHGHKCFSMVHGKPKCPKGFKMSKESSKCVRKVKHSESSCPPGYSSPSHDIHHSFCERNTQSSPHLSCPIDASLDPSSGQCLSELIGSSSCPHGFQLSRNQDGMCEQIIEEIGNCPIGTVAIGHGAGIRCQSSIDNEMTECCPPGYDQVGHGKCERREYFKAVPSCTDCTIVKKLPVQFSCPSGYISHGTSCSREIPASPCGQHDCSMYDDMIMMAASSSSSGGSLRSSSSLQDLSSIPSECLQPRDDCTKAREEIIPAIVKCPTNSIFSGYDYCEERTEQNQEAKCLIGSIDISSGKCMRLSSVPIKSECSQGSTRVGNRCVHYEEHAPDFSCPNGSIVDHKSGSCLIRTPAESQRGEIIRTPPIAMCSSGSMHDFTCWDVDRISRSSSSCPAGSVPAETHHLHKDKKDASKYCLVFAELIVPAPHKKYHRPSYFCADGRQSHGKSCHHSDKANPIPSCPTGSSVDLSVDGHHSCIRRMTPITSAQTRFTSSIAIPVCPGGTSVQGTKCVATREAAPQLTCPPGYQSIQTNNISSSSVGSSECAKVADMIQVCSVGTTQTPDGCLKEIRVQPIVSSVPINQCGENDCY